MKFIVLAEDSMRERSAIVVTAENMPSALFTLAAEAARAQEDFLNGECTIIPMCDQHEDVNAFDLKDEYMIQSFLSGHLQRVNICDICICEDCESGLCHSEGYSGKPIECCKDRLDAAIMEEMQEKEQVTFTMGRVTRIDLDDED